ncbi:MAG: Fe-S cluster assembly protein SufD [Deltaproteobacteria bacterium]|nr:Fe-S cluster assembly protein SufD [Deltaproteobacteria bacterium]
MTQAVPSDQGTLLELLEGGDQARRGAHAAVLEAGLPHAKLEAWRSTPLRELPKALFSRQMSRFEVEDASASLQLTRVSSTDVADLQRLGSLTTQATFTALNAALFDELLHVHVPAGATETLSLSQRAAAGSAGFPRLLVTLESRSSLTLIEHYSGEPGEASFAGPVTEIFLAEGARLDHTRLLDAPSHHVAELDVRVARDASYTLHLATLGGALSRTDVRVTLAEQGAECALFGATHATDTQVADVHVWLEHAAPHCTSRQRFHSVLDGRARAVVDGIVAVAPGAQKTEAHQNLATLLLSEGCRVDAKPHMEIEADDVVCSHGNTVGALDDEALFYLRSRGIGEGAARSILTWAFVKRVLDGIPEAARANIEHAFLARFTDDDLDLTEL